VDDRNRVRLLERALQQAQAQNRRLVADLDWAEEQVRVYRRLVERLVTEKDREDRP
jgi:hypothetical protein